MAGKLRSSSRIRSSIILTSQQRLFELCTADSKQLCGNSCILTVLKGSKLYGLCSIFDHPRSGLLKASSDGMWVELWLKLLSQTAVLA